MTEASGLSKIFGDLRWHLSATLGKAHLWDGLTDIEFALELYREIRSLRDELSKANDMIERVKEIVQ